MNPTTLETSHPDAIGDGILATVWQHSPCSIMVTDRSGRIERVNPAFIALNGYSEEELIGRQPGLLRADGLGGAVYKELWETILQGQVWTGRLHNKRKDGSMYWAVVTIRPVFDSSGAISRFLSISENITAEVEASEEARGTREENDLLAMQSGTVFWRVDETGLYTTVGGTSMQVWGYQPCELIGKMRFHDLFAPLNRDALRRDVLRIFERKEPFVSFLNPILRPDGRITWVETNAVPMIREDGSLAGYVGTDKDVTALKAAQVELANAAGMLRAVINSTPDLIFAKDLGGRTLICNKACAALLGKKPEHMIGRTDQENGWPAADVEKYRKEDQRVLSGETVHIPNDRAEWDGEVLWFDTIKVPMRSASGEILGVLGVSRDVTLIRRAEEERSKREMLFMQAQQIASLGGWEHDFSQDTVTMSPEACRIFGFDPSEDRCSRKSLLERVHPDDRLDLEERYLGSIRDGLPTFEWEYRILREPSAPVVHVRLRCQHQRDESGRTVSSVGVVKDVTSRMLLEQQFRQMQKMESIGRLAGGVAHDFNNMLGVILGHTELLLDAVPPIGRMHESLREIQYASNRSAALTRQLLAFARCQPVKPAVVDVNEAIESMIKMLRRLIGEDIDLRWTPCPEPCRVFIDPSQIDQILANLCVNARDAIGNGVGVLEIHTMVEDVSPAPEDNHSGLSSGPHVVLSIRDNGCGMDDKTMERIFEPFFTTKAAGLGTGLGLSTVFGIVKQNHGCIRVKSHPGTGSTFVIHLPLCTEASLPVAAEEIGPLPGGHETILLVEDEASVLSLAAAIIGSLGYRVITASSPGEAIAISNADPGAIDLLVTDVVMPGMNGRELADVLKEIRPGLPVLYVSGHASGLLTSQGIGMESTACLQKPYTVSELAAGLRGLLPRIQEPV